MGNRKTTLNQQLVQHGEGLPSTILVYTLMVRGEQRKFYLEDLNFFIQLRFHYLKMDQNPILNSYNFTLSYVATRTTSY